MKTDLKISLILLLISTFGAYLLSENIYLKIPVCFGFEISEHNFFVALFGGLITLILWLIVIIIVFAISIAGALGVFITPFLVLISLFTGDKMFGGSSSNNSSNSYGTSNSGYTNSDSSYTQENLKKIEKEAISKGILAPGKRGQYIDKKTGKFKEDFFFNLLSKDTNESINLKNGNYQTKNTFGIKTDTGKRIDLDTGQISKETFFGGYEKTNTRINQDSGRIEKKGFFGDWQKTDERVNPDTGKTQEKDALGIFWKDKDE